MVLKKKLQTKELPVKVLKKIHRLKEESITKDIAYFAN